tara:strand:- start:585 stop:1133 length:549 start_codon:yes stop_codon:yes gene_type:complete
MNKVVKIKKEKSLEAAISESSISFKSIDQGIDILAFSAAIRALGLSNRDLKPKKLSNYIRSGYLQIQLICAVILFQFRGDTGVGRDQLYDAVCEVFPMTTYANFRKVLRLGVDNEIFIRTRSEKDSRRTLYTISPEMIEPIGSYFLSILADFGNLYSDVIDSGLSNNDILKLLERMKGNVGV